jgi:hypothetical protein
MAPYLEQVPDLDPVVSHGSELGPCFLEANRVEGSLAPLPRKSGEGLRPRERPDHDGSISLEEPPTDLRVGLVDEERDEGRGIPEAHGLKALVALVAYGLANGTRRIRCRREIQHVPWDDARPEDTPRFTLEHR